MLSVPPRRPDRRPRNQREERRPVTIIAGFPITGWVVLGADAEEGGLFAKSSVEKIAVINGEDYKCLIGGAGDADFIDFAVQEAEQDLKASNIPITLEVLRLTLEKVVTEIYLPVALIRSLHTNKKTRISISCARSGRRNQERRSWFELGERSVLSGSVLNVIGIAWLTWATSRSHRAARARIRWALPRMWNGCGAVHLGPAGESGAPHVKHSRRGPSASSVASRWHY